MDKILLTLFMISFASVFSQDHNPGGITGTRAWLKTAYNEENGEYVWKNFSCDTIQINHQTNLDSASAPQSLLTLRYVVKKQYLSKLK